MSVVRLVSKPHHPVAGPNKQPSKACKVVSRKMAVMITPSCAYSPRLLLGSRLPAARGWRRSDRVGHSQRGAPPLSRAEGRPVDTVPGALELDPFEPARRLVPFGRRPASPKARSGQPQTADVSKDRRSMPLSANSGPSRPATDTGSIGVEVTMRGPLRPNHP